MTAPESGQPFAKVVGEASGYPKCFEVHVNGVPVYFSDARESAQRIAERINAAVAPLQAKAELAKSAQGLLVEAHRRFVKYEMDVDDDAPVDHKQFMERLKNFIDALTKAGEIGK